MKQFMSEKMFPTQMVFVGLENRGVYEAGIRFKGTPEGDGSVFSTALISACLSLLDLKVLRKGTEV